MKRSNITHSFSKHSSGSRWAGLHLTLHQEMILPSLTSSCAKSLGRQIRAMMKPAQSPDEAGTDSAQRKRRVSRVGNNYKREEEHPRQGPQQLKDAEEGSEKRNRWLG